MAIFALAIGIDLATAFILVIILPRLYVPLGRSPKELQPEVYAQYFAQSTDLPDEKRLKLILKDELEMLQGCIDVQERKNKNDTFLFTLSLLSALCAIIA